MKALALAAAVAASVICSAGTADAQYRSRGNYRYIAPTYVNPAYTYTAPSYYSGVVSSSYTTPFVSGYSPVVYPSSYSYPSTWNEPYYGSYYSPTYYGGGYGSGVYISPRGVSWRGGGWRW